MKELFDSYSLSQIFAFTVILILAIKEVISFFDWANSRIRQEINKQDKPIQVEKITKQHSKQLEKIQQEFKSLKDILQILIQSDQDMIRLTIKKEHHFYVYQKGCIDAYSLDCIERLYERYVSEGGNTYVKTLMQDLRELPKE